MIKISSTQAYRGDCNCNKKTSRLSFLGKTKNVSYDGTLTKSTSNVDKNGNILNSANQEKQTEQKMARLKSICIQRICRKEKNTENFGQFPRPYLLARF